MIFPYWAGDCFNFVQKEGKMFQQLDHKVYDFARKTRNSLLSTRHFFTTPEKQHDIISMILPNFTRVSSAMLGAGRSVCFESGWKSLSIKTSNNFCGYMGGRFSRMV